MSSDSKIYRVRQEVEECQNVMADNVSRMIENQESTHDVLAKTGDLEESSRLFQRRATSVQREMWWRRYKLWLIVAGGVFLCVCILIIILATK